jgi:hypothetical protein
MSNIRRRFASMLVVLFSAVAIATATGADAQAPRGQGGHAGPGGPGGGGAPLVMLLLDAQVHTALALTSTQETQWTALQSAQDSLRTQLENAHASLDAFVKAQFASGAPDLVAIEASMQAQRQAMGDAMDALDTQAIALYSGLSTGQEAVVVAAAQTRYLQRQAQQGASMRPSTM